MSGSRKGQKSVTGVTLYRNIETRPSIAIKANRIKSKE
jgi:hypothetical protein